MDENEQIRRLKETREDVIYALLIKAKAYEEAAIRLPDHAEWRNGVACGLRAAIALLKKEAGHG